MECTEVDATEGCEFLFTTRSQEQNKTVLWNGRQVKVLPKEANILLQKKLNFAELVPNLQDSVASLKDHMWIVLEVDEEDEEPEHTWRLAKAEIIHAHNEKENATVEEVLAHAGFEFDVNHERKIILCRPFFKKAGDKCKKVAKKVEHVAKKGIDWVKDHKKGLLIGAAILGAGGAVGLLVASGSAASAGATAGAAAALSAKESSPRRREEEEERSSEESDSHSQKSPEPSPHNASPPSVALPELPQTKLNERSILHAIDPQKQLSPYTDPQLTTSSSANALQQPSKLFIATPPPDIASSTPRVQNSVNRVFQDIRKNPLVTGWNKQEDTFAKPPLKNNPQNQAEPVLDTSPIIPPPNVFRTPKIIPEPFESKFPSNVLLHAIDPEIHPSPLIDFLKPGKSGELKEICESIYYKIEGTRQEGLDFSHVNGMRNTFKEATGHALYLHSLSSGMEINGIYNHSNGLFIDALEIAVFNYVGNSPVTVELIKNRWINFHENNRDNPYAKIFQSCHSQGALHVKNALMQLPEEIRQRVIVVAIAPAVVVPEKLCYKSFNYASKRDIVPHGEVVHGLLRSSVLEEQDRAELLYDLGESRKELIILEPHPEATGVFDHEFQSKTYEEVLKYHIEEYQNQKGQFK